MEKTEKRGGFFRHYMVATVEGFQLQHFLSQCLQAGILLRQVQLLDELTLRARVPEDDWPALRKIAGNRYKVEVLREGGLRPRLLTLLGKKGTLAGLVLFAALLFYQSLFLSEIRVEGYESLSETELRESLAAAGFYEGCSKSIDIEQVKLALYKEFDQLAWVGISYHGNLAVVSVAEGKEVPAPESGGGVCHITAQKEGFIEEVIAKEGKALVEPGDYVRAGDVLITGILPIEDKSYGNVPGKPTERYVRADGSVKARIFYTFLCHQERWEVVKEPTGRKAYGLRLQVGNLELDSTEFFRTEKGFGKEGWFRALGSGTVERHKIVGLLRPFPLRLEFVEVTEAVFSKQERSQEAIERTAETQVRQLIRESLPENAELANKGLSFSSGENIIDIVVMLQAVEEIGGEQSFTVTDPGKTGPEGGTEGIGEPTD